jgi:hypothetical protein
VDGTDHRTWADKQDRNAVGVQHEQRSATRSSQQYIALWNRRRAAGRECAPTSGKLIYHDYSGSVDLFGGGKSFAIRRETQSGERTAAILIHQGWLVSDVRG